MEVQVHYDRYSNLINTAGIYVGNRRRMNFKYDSKGRLVISHIDVSGKESLVLELDKDDAKQFMSLMYNLNANIK